jgi:hypothetical protein
MPLTTVHPGTEWIGVGLGDELLDQTGEFSDVLRRNKDDLIPGGVLEAG